MRTVVATVMLCIVVPAPMTLAQEQGAAKSDVDLQGARKEIYRTIEDDELPLFVFEPQERPAGETSAGIVFFFGGGWANGTPRQFAPHCRYLASRGMTAIAVSYRTRSSHGATVKDCVDDAQDAMRWVRQNAERLGIDPERIVVAGGSAGGHLAACTVLLSDPSDSDKSGPDAPAPCAMVLFNPVMALASIDGQDRFLEDWADRARIQFGADPKSLSPAHHIRKGLPPTLMLFGDQDKLLPVAQQYARLATDAGNRCEIKIYPGHDHAFFNFRRRDPEMFLQTTAALDAFLVDQGCLEGEENVREWLGTE